MSRTLDQRVESAVATPSTGNGFGIASASALVVGSVIGTGVFALPSALASFGPISLVAFVLVTIGAIALALTFRSLNARLPGSGGPYLYARDAFGEFAGFLNAWSYWITAWAGNAAIVVAWVGYVEVFWNTDHSLAGSVVIALVGLWLPALVNLAGLRSIAAFQVVTTVLKFVPLLLVATIGLFFMSRANFGEFNASGGSSWSAISDRRRVALFCLPRHRDGVRGGRPGPRPGAERRPGDSAGDARVRGGVPARDPRGVRHRPACGAGRLDRAVHRLRGCDLRGRVGGQDGRGGCSGLRVRRPGRLDTHRGRDAAGCCPRRGASPRCS